MNQNKIGFTLLTKWVFEYGEDADSPSIISTGDVVDEESLEGLDACLEPSRDAIDNPDIGNLDDLWERGTFGPEADPVGGWIVETQEEARKELVLSWLQTHRARNVSPNRTRSIDWVLSSYSEILFTSGQSGTPGAPLRDREIRNIGRITGVSEVLRFPGKRGPCRQDDRAFPVDFIA